LLVGRKAIEKLFSTDFTGGWSSSPFVGKFVQMYAFEDSIATISEWSIGQYDGHSVKIFVRDADTGGWKIRMEYYGQAPVVTHQESPTKVGFRFLQRLSRKPILNVENVSARMFLLIVVVFLISACTEYND
jgi:hypothetical protein